MLFYAKEFKLFYILKLSKVNQFEVFKIHRFFCVKKYANSADINLTWNVYFIREN